MLTRVLGQALRNRREIRARERRAASCADLPRAAVIFGAGSYPGIGAAVGLRAAREVQRVLLCGRSPDKLRDTAGRIEAAGGHVVTRVCDAGDEQQVASAFADLAADGYAAEFVLHNVGSNRPGRFLDIDPGQLAQSWRDDCLSGFHVGQYAIRHMLDHGGGTLLYSGASASLRGRAGFAGFASNKAGLRALAQSLAREFGPHRIHVAHVVIDGVVDGSRIREHWPQALDQRETDGALDPDAIADCYWQLHRQHPSAWTHELDLRPFSETW